MDVDSAKTVVSALLVLCIAGFSIVSFHAFFAEVSRDLKAVRAKRAKADDSLPID